METQVKFYPAQEVPSSEMNAIQDYTQRSFDHIVRDTLVRDNYYIGMAVSQTGAAALNVAVGRIYIAGAVYAFATASPINLTPYLPAGLNKKRVSIVASGVEAETTDAPRKFLVDPTTRTSRPRTVATRTERQVVISIIEGPEGASPVAATVAAGYIEIATVDLSSTGIIDGPNRSRDAIVPNLEDAITMIDILQGEWAQQQAQIKTLRTDIAALAKQVSAAARQVDLRVAFNDIASIRETLDIPDTWSPVGFDTFATSTECDLTNASWSGEVWAGAFHFDETKTSVTPTLVNPLSTAVIIHPSGLMLPAFTEEIRTKVVTKSGELILNSLAQVTHNLTVQQEGVVVRWEGLKHQAFVRNALLRSVAAIELYLPAISDIRNIATGNYQFDVRDSNLKTGETLWHNTVGLVDEAEYWAEPATTETLSGSTVAQTFLNAQSGWLTSINLGFTAVGATGGVVLRLCKVTKEGEPNLSRVLAVATVAQADLKSWPTWTNFPLKPTHLARGERYAIVIKTVGAHRMATSNSNELTSGCALTATDSTTWDSRAAIDLLFQANFATFKSARVILELNPVALSGGIGTLNCTWTGVHPVATNFVLQAQIAGVWRTYDYRTTNVFATAPDLVPLRLVIDLTQDDAPGLYLNKSRFRVGRQKGTATYISTVRSAPPAYHATEIQVNYRLLGWNGDIHTAVPKLLTGAGYTTQVSATTVVMLQPANKDEIVLRATFSSVSLDSWKIRLNCTTSDVTQPFSILGRTDYISTHS